MKKQSQENAIVDMHWILEFCSKLALQACKIVKESFQNSQVKTFMKGFNDPVTEADYKIQTMLIKGIRKHYPTIKIVGEEDVQYQGKIDTDYQNLSNLHLPETVRFTNQYKCDDLCIWIDPIDNTKGFISGKAEEVTVLIGISCNKKSQIGVIGTPYQKHGEGFIYKPSVIIGCASSGFASQFCSQSQKWTTIHRPENHKNQPLIVLSPSRQNIIEGEVAKQIKGKIIYANGAGYKGEMVIKNQADLHIFCFSFTKKWDSCAAQAIIKALNGYYCDVFGDEIIYDHNAKHFVNDKGVLCGFNTDYKDATVKICKSHNQSNL